MCRFEERRERALGINGFVDELVVALVNAGIYWAEHPRVEAAIHELQRLHGEVLSQSGQSTLVLGVSDGCLVYERRALVGASLAAPRIIKPLTARGSGGIEFDRDVSERDFTALVAVLAKKVGADEDYKETNRELESMGCERIGLLPPFQVGLKDTRRRRNPYAEPGDGSISGRRSIRIPVQLYQGVVDHLQTATVSVCQGGRIDLQQIQSTVEGMVRSVSESASSMMRVSRYERYDAFTFNHSIRVCTLALNFVRALTDNDEILNRVGIAALLHDVGKSRVPFDVLHHEGRLSSDQRREMEKHPSYGAEILLDHRGVDDMAVASALGHHRTLSNGGYPRMIHDAHLSKVTKIVKICDVYEALTAVRPYKNAMSPTRAFRIMFTMDGHFDLGVLRRFVEVNGIYPAGSRVRLSNGMFAYVESQTGTLRAPIVELVENEDGTRLDDEDRALLDLSQQGEGSPVTIEELMAEDLLEASTR